MTRRTTIDDVAKLAGVHKATVSRALNADTQHQVSVETVTADGATHVVGVTDKSIAGDPWFVESGHMFPADLPTADAEAVAVAAIEALGLDRGVAHTEVKLTPDGPKLVEVNPRPAGNQITELVRRVTGIDLPAAYAQLARRTPVCAAPRSRSSSRRAPVRSPRSAAPRRSAPLRAWWIGRSSNPVIGRATRPATTAISATSW